MVTNVPIPPTVTQGITLKLPIGLKATKPILPDVKNLPNGKEGMKAPIPKSNTTYFPAQVKLPTPSHPKSSLKNGSDSSSLSGEYSDVDVNNIAVIPSGNYDIITTKFRLLPKYPNVWILENISQDVYQKMKVAKKLFIHVDGRNQPVNLSKTKWASQVHSYMIRRGYKDPRAGWLISPRSKRYYEFWECNSGFDFMRFERSIFRRNGEQKYGHLCHLSIILDNVFYYVRIFM